MFVLMLVHWVLVGVDLGRTHWSEIPEPLRVTCLAGYAMSMCVVFYTMKVNRFYSSAVRIQSDRGRQVITAGPYRLVRHPGYTASLVAFLCGGIAMGSWVGLIPLTPVLPLFLRRTLIEDAMLKAELPGYAEYAERVKYRLFPGIF